MLDSLLTFIRKEAVLCIAFACALVSCCFAGVGPDTFAETLSYIDMRVLVLLFCLMASVAGLEGSGLFSWCAEKLVARCRSERSLCLTLVLLPFFASMVVTNDVALLAFVPFAAMALRHAGNGTRLASVAVLQAVAANLGGMVTPIGNPQNLFIYMAYDLSLAEFTAALAPFALAALALLSAACLRFGGEGGCASTPLDRTQIRTKRFAFYGALLALCLASVVRVLPHQVLFIVVAGLLAIFDRKAFARVDYALLGTFVCFFVFSGNMAHFPIAQDVLGGLMQNHPMLTSVAASQVVSNVPAAVLLSGFTDNWHSLLLGVDLGGLGTPVASLASLIAFRLYMHTPDASARTFFREFVAANAVGLTAMLALYALIFVM